MPIPTPRWRGRLALSATAVLLTAAGPAAAGAMASPGAVFTQTNDPAGNVVQHFARAADGTLRDAGAVATGGAGLASLGGRQGAVALAADGRTVYAVNAGSNTVTTLRAGRRGLTVRGTVSSGGDAPISVDRHRGRAYVLNSGATPNVTTFAVRRDGTLRPLAGGTRELPGALGAAQVEVAPSGRALVVSERLSNRLETLPLDVYGRPREPVITASSGAVPFGFALTRSGVLVVSEAGASTVSSYKLGRRGALTPVTASLAVGQGAACWVAVSPDGRLAFTGNAAGGIGAFAVGGRGALSPLATTVLLPSPRDLAFSRDGRFLYAVSPGADGGSGQVTGYRVGRDGALTLVTSVPALPGLTGAAAS